jgi:hypothetical protein
LVVALLSAVLYLVVCFVSLEKRGGKVCLRGFGVYRSLMPSRRGTSGGLRERERQIADAVVVVVVVVVFAVAARSSPGTAAASEQPQCLE